MSRAVSSTRLPELSRRMRERRFGVAVAVSIHPGNRKPPALKTCGIFSDAKRYIPASLSAPTDQLFVKGRKTLELPQSNQ